MKVEVKITPEAKEPYAIIYTAEMTDEISSTINGLSGGKTSDLIVAKDEDRMVILKPSEILMVKVENEKTLIYTADKILRSGKRLYEIRDELRSDFMQISKSAIINLKYLESVEPSFNGLMLLKLKGGISEYISRKFVPDLKKYLGL